MNNQTIVKGIICRDCGKELPEMTVEQHLNEVFVKECPHINENFYKVKNFLREILKKIDKSNFRKYKTFHIYDDIEREEIIYVHLDKRTKTYYNLMRLLDENNINYSIYKNTYYDNLLGCPNQSFTFRITQL
jgi:hypothetical protein